MRFIFAAALAVHGLIHLLGCAKAFQLAAVPALSQEITTTAGVFWLLGALLWLAAAALIFNGMEQWWIPAGAALVISQGLIVASWADARFGTLVNLTVLVPVVVSALAHAPWSFRTRYDRGTAVAADEIPGAGGLVTDADLQPLPAPVQEYLRYAGAVGRPRVGNYRVRFRGAIRASADAPWMPSTTDQFSRVHPASRWFLMRATRRGVPFEALHVYQGSHATFEVRIAGVKTVVDARGPEMDQSETVTLFNDMCLLAPASLIDPAIEWRVVGERAVSARFTNAGHTIAADLSFDASGALVDFVSDDRYQSADGKTFVSYRWTTPVSAYRAFGGRRVASTAEARWTMPDGEFSYARFEVVDVAYNVTGDGGSRR